MLTLSKLGAHSLGYYESTTARVQGFDGQDYYTEGGEAPPSAWVAARDSAGVEATERMVGVVQHERLTPQQIEAWFNQNQPPSGAKAGRAFRDNSVRGFDLTFAAPKSVSLLWGLSEDEEVQRACERAHQAAIVEARAYLAEHAAYTRVHNPETEKKDLVKLAGLSGVQYDHRTSRARDPHLHTHVLLHNRQVREDGGWGSIDGTSLYHEARAAGTIYQARLRAELSRSLGVEWELVDPETGMADVRGVDRAQIESWSQRHSEINAWVDEHLTETGAAGSATAQKATREKKDLAGISTEQLRAEWRSDERARGLDVTAAGERALSGVEEPTPSVDAVLDLVAAHRSTYTRSDVVEAAASLWPATAPPASVRADIEALTDRATGASTVLSVDPDRQAGERAPHEREGSVRYSSDQVLQMEQRLFSTATEVDPALAVDHVDDRDLTDLSGDQAEAMRAIAESPHRATVLTAPAGAGKTRSLAGLRAVYERGGRHVVGLAPTGRAADQLVADEGAATADTIAVARQKIDGGRHGWGEQTVVVLDEAGMAGSGDLDAILTAAKGSRSKVVLVGDPAQLQPVQARGGALELLASAPGTQHLSEVWRQRDPEERDASRALRDAPTGPALREAREWYLDRNRITSGSTSTALDAALDDWREAERGREDCLMLAGTREQAQGLNAAAQAERLKRGDVHFQKDRGGLRNGQRCGVGDRILSRRNSFNLRATEFDAYGRPVDAGPVRNGHRWEVRGFDRAGGALVRRLDGGATAVLDPEYLAEHVDLGYAGTVHAAQGATADRSTAVLDVDAATRSQAYVALTRGRNSNRLHLAERRAGDQPHEHAPADRAPERRTNDTTETAQLFRGVTERDDRDRAALRRIATGRREYLRARTPETAERDGDAWQRTAAGKADRERAETRARAAAAKEGPERQQQQPEQASPSSVPEPAANKGGSRWDAIERRARERAAQRDRGRDSGLGL